MDLLCYSVVRSPTASVSMKSVPDSDDVLGSGSYGTVYRVGSIARKKIEKIDYTNW